MIRYATFSALLAGALVITSCSAASVNIVGSGTATTEQRTVASFTKVSVDNAIKAAVIVGSDTSIAVTADDNVLSSISTSVDGGKLTVTIQGGIQPLTQVVVAVTVPSLEEAEVSSAANVTITGVNSPSFSASADSAGSLVVRGNADAVDVSASSAGSADLGGVPAQSATIMVGSAATVTVNAQIAVTGSVDTGAVAHIEGHPASVNVSTDSGGAVVRD